MPDAESKTATIKKYSNIKIKSLSATRQNNIGTITTLNFEGEFWNASFGSVANAITSCKYKYKTTSSSTWIDGKTTLTYTISGNKITGSLNIQGDAGTDGFSVANSFDIQLILADKLSSATYNIILSSGNPALAIYKNNVAIGQQYNTSEGSKFQVNGDISLTNRANGININGHKGILRHWTNDSQMCAKKNYDLVLVARDEQKLKELEKELKESNNIKIETISMDLSQEENCIDLHKNVKDVDILINNAGFGDCGNFTHTELKKELSMIKTNIIAYHILTKLYLVDMKAKNSGKILNVASIAGFMPGPLMATYYYHHYKTKNNKMETACSRACI